MLKFTSYNITNSIVKRRLTCMGSTISVFTSVYIITSLSNSKLDKRMFSMMNGESCDANDHRPSLVFLSMEDEEEVTIFKLYLKNCQLIKHITHPLCVSHTSPSAVSTQVRCAALWPLLLYCDVVFILCFSQQASKQDENVGNTHLLRDQRAWGPALFFIY